MQNTELKTTGQDRGSEHFNKITKEKSQNKVFKNGIGNFAQQHTQNIEMESRWPSFWDFCMEEMCIEHL